MAVIEVPPEALVDLHSALTNDPSVSDEVITPRGAEAHIIGDRLVISLRTSTLAFAARNSDYFVNCAEGGTQLKVTDDAALAHSVCCALNVEDEMGHTPVTRMLDSAVEYVSEWGMDGIEEVYDAEALGEDGDE